MNREEIKSIVQEYLAQYLNCTVQDLQKDGVVFCINGKKSYPFLEVCTMGRAVVVSASGKLLPRVKSLMERKTRDEIFECPLVYGQSVYFIPDEKILAEQSLSDEYEYRLLEREDIGILKDISGFENALSFDKDGVTSICIVLYAMKNGEIAAIAGASEEAERMWELGIDVKPEYRKKGLASALISNLACKILERGIVPFYCASVTNIASQAVAHRSGFTPCWVSTYRNILDGSSAYDDLLSGLKGEWYD